MMKRLPNDCFFSLVEDDIHHGKSVRFRMKGSSMFPLLREGKDEVAVYPCKAESLKPMDVVLFRYRGRCLLHRIVGMKDGRFIMQGMVFVRFMRSVQLRILSEYWEWLSGFRTCRVGFFFALAYLERLWRSLGVFRKVGLCIFHRILF